MPDVPYTSTIRVACHQSFHGEEAVNVFHIVTTSNAALTSTIATDIANAFSLLYDNESSVAAPGRGISNYRSPQAVLDRITVYDLRTVPNPSPFEIAYSVAGSGASAVLPLDVAVAATLRTAVSGRSGRGRNYYGPLANIMNAGTASAPPQVTPTIVTDFAEAIVDLNDRLNALVTVPGPYSLGVLSVAQGIVRPVTQVRVDGRPDTQRRRDLGANFPSPVILDVS